MRRQATNPGIQRLLADLAPGCVPVGQEAQLLLRDIHAAGQHMALAWDVAGAAYGRVVLGLPPGLDL